MNESQALAAMTGLVALILLPIIAWLAKRQIDALERGTKERDEKLEQDINALGAKVQTHYHEMLRDYVHEDRLKERMESALAPIAATLSRIERTIENDVRDLFMKLDKKADR